MKKYFAAFILMAAVVSCGPRLIYPHLEWLIPWYISDYISLDDHQKNMLEERLLKQLDWHCRTQLTIYAATLRAIGRDFTSDNQPLGYSKMQFYNQRLRKLWQKLLLRIAPDVTDILLTASENQITELFDNLQEQNRRLKAEYVDLQPRILDENRQKRMLKRLNYWISDVTREQKEAVSAWSSELVPLSGDWLQNRELIQAEARRLLTQAKSNPSLRKSLQGLIIYPERMRSPVYQEKIDINTDITIKFMIGLDRLLSPQQRSYLKKRTESLADDFDKLSCDPKDRPNRSSEVWGFRLRSSSYDGTSRSHKQDSQFVCL